MGDRVGGWTGVLGVWTYIRSFILEVLEKIAGVTRKSRRQVEGLAPISIFCVHTRQPVIPSVLLHQSPGASQTCLHLHAWVQAGPLFSSMAPWGVATYLSPMKTICKLCSVGARVPQTQRTTGMERAVQASGTQVHANLDRDISSHRLRSVRKEIC